MIIFKPYRTVSWLVLLLIVAVPALAADFIALDEIHRGMKGFGLTVFEGSRIDTFAVEVIGIQKKSRVDGSLILVEVSGHGLEKSSIAQGMSGSPIYLEGRFAGALAFGWAGALRPLAGVTPAQDILGLPVNPETIPPSRAMTGSGGSQDLKSLMTDASGPGALAASLFDLEPGLRPEGNRDWPRPETMALDLLRSHLGHRGFELPGDEHWIFSPLGAGSTSAGNVEPGPDLEPGAACAVPLVTGDAMLGVTGTVTWTEDQDVLMMGHPFMQRGPVDLPLATAEVLTVFPSRQMSFKMGSVGRIVGTVHHDQRAGLAGKLGPSPRMIPVTVDVGLAGEPENRRSYHFEVVDDPLLTPSLVFWTLYNSVLAEGDDASSQNIHYELKSHWKGAEALGGEPLKLRGVAAGPGGAMALAGDWMAPFSLLLDNPFEPVSLQSVHARLDLSRPLVSAQITGLDAPRHPAVGSGPLQVQVEISERLGQSHWQTIELDLPASLEPGPYRLVAASAADFFALETQRAASRFQVTSLDAVFEVLHMDRSADQLVVALLAPGRGLMVADREMTGLPRSVSRVLKQGNMQIQATLADFAVRQSRAMTFPLQGHAVRKLEILPAVSPIREERRP